MGRGCIGLKITLCRREAVNCKTLFLDQVTKVALMLAADKRYAETLSGQSVCQGEATHDVTGADGRRGIGADDKVREYAQSPPRCSKNYAYRHFHTDEVLFCLGKYLMGRMNSYNYGR
jgi:hypothetical protein